MADNELLFAISEMMNSKLTPLKEAINDIKVRVQSIDSRIEKLESRIDALEIRMDNMEVRMDHIESRLQNLESDVHTIKLIQEIDIIPRLQNIETCYVSTYERYSSGIIQLDTMQSDIDVIKTVLITHSEKLQTVS